MKQGCPLIADIALRERALKVLMSYSPAWLRLGLFVVLGPNVLHTLGVGASDAYTEVFLERHFLGDVCLAKTYATNKSVFLFGEQESVLFFLHRFMATKIVLKQSQSLSVNSTGLSKGCTGMVITTVWESLY